MTPTDNLQICVASLATEEGCTAAAIQAAQVIKEDVLGPLLEHTPPHMRQVLVERFMSGIAGAACESIGPQLVLQSLDEVKIAVAAVASKRARANAH